MEYANLGNSGLKVSKVILGAMSFGSSKWFDWVIDDEKEVFKLLKHAYDSGLRTWDTANVYSSGESERLIGRFLKEYNIPRSSIVLMTKCYVYTEDEPSLEKDPFKQVNRMGLSRKHIFDAIDKSLERLGVDYVDVYQIHRHDPDTPKDETMKALDDLVKSGKVRYIGASAMRAVEFAQYQFAAEKNGGTKFISMQDYYNLVYREEEREMIPFCKSTGVGIIPYSPVARGFLTRPVGSEANSVRAKTDPVVKGATSAPTLVKVKPYFVGTSEAHKTIARRVEEIANKRGTSMACVAIAWSLAKGAMPIVGFNKVERIDEAISAISLKLTDQEVEYLEEPYEPQDIQGYA
uniref:ARAD1D30448p n=1 Tax=Blastobotrys adeninivorans TaxID=409370 RepID=A0A060TBD0_BLAAD